MDNQKLRSYLTAVIQAGAKYDLSQLSDDELVKVSMLFASPAINFDDWSARVYGKSLDEMTDEDAAAVNAQAFKDEEAIYG